MRVVVRWHELDASCRRMLGFGMACVLVLLIANVVYRGFILPSRQPSLPDLKSCTRIEICFLGSALDYMYPADTDRVVLSSIELERLQSLEKIAVDNPERISAIVRVLEATSYDGPLQKGGRYRGAEFRLVCYRDGAPPTSLRILTFWGKLVVATAKGDTFKLKKPLMGYEVLLQGAWPFMARSLCKECISSLGTALDDSLWDEPEQLRVKTWCDDCVKRYQREEGLNPEIISALFRCAAAGRGRCHYAMNAGWEPNCSPDTVKLFETTAGWNKRGGRELFTFDHHEPRGGCVLLESGAIKFIRTEEELHALRWE